MENLEEKLEKLVAASMKWIGYGMRGVAILLVLAAPFKGLYLIGEAVVAYIISLFYTYSAMEILADAQEADAEEVENQKRE